MPTSPGPVFAAALLSVLLTGCAGDDSSAARSTPTFRAPLAGGIVVSPQELIDRAGNTLPCSTPVPITSPDRALEQIDCSGGTVVIRTYIDAPWGEAVNTIFLLGRAGYDTLSGTNWTISSLDSADLTQVQSRLGGTIHTAASQK